ncbi:MAG: hypothetical protein H0U74_20865 [Bradymonadaceae bacterium]|nr:hypothetical protein [Lujinxingiaceae bacterium]
MREEIHAEAKLRLYLVETPEGQLVVEIESDAGGPDLSVEDEVVVVVDGQARSVEAQSARAARAVVGAVSALEDRPFELMVRVHEFFEGWDFNTDEE